MGDITVKQPVAVPYFGPSRFISTRKHSLEIVGDQVLVDGKAVEDPNAKQRIRERSARFDGKASERPWVMLGMMAGLAAEVALMVCPITSVPMSVGTFWTAMGSAAGLDTLSKYLTVRRAAQNMQPSNTADVPVVPQAPRFGVVGGGLAGALWPALAGACLGNAIDRRLTLHAARHIAAEATQPG